MFILFINFYYKANIFKYNYNYISNNYIIYIIELNLIYFPLGFPTFLYIGLFFKLDK